MRILIIGGTGNISTAIVHALVERGDDVTLYNRGNRIIPGVKCIKGDRTNYIAFEQQILKEDVFDCVIDMVCYSPEDAKNAVRTFKGMLGQYIFCSTVDVYTKPARRYPIREEDERKPSLSFEYAYNKALCENIFEEAHSKGFFPVTIIRPAATYNDACTPISMLGSGTACLKRIRQGKPIIVLGDGTSIWVSSHSDDVGHAFIGAAGNPDTYGKSYNVTGDEFITWQEYYHTVAIVMGAPNIDFVHIPADLIVSIAPKSAAWCVMNFKYSNIFDNSTAKRDLGYKYNISWEEGIRRILSYQDSKNFINECPEEPYYDIVLDKFNTAKLSLIKELAYLDI